MMKTFSNVEERLNIEGTLERQFTAPPLPEVALEDEAKKSSFFPLRRLGLYRESAELDENNQPVFKRQKKNIRG